MRIGLDGIPLTAPKTGVGHYTFELARALACLSPKDDFELVYPATFPAVRLSNGAPDSSIPANLKDSRVPVGPLSRHWWSVGLPRHVRSAGFDLFHGTNYDVPLRRRCPTVLTVHDLSLLTHPETHEPRRVRRARWRLPLMLRAANFVLTPTESVRLDVCNRFAVSPEKVVAVAEAARSTFRPQDYENAKSVKRRLGINDHFMLAVGTLEPRKNLRLLARAFELVSRDLPEPCLQLVVAGGMGWLTEPILAELERSMARERIVFTGYLNDEDLRSLYSTCRLFIYPSLDEGFGLPVLEAMQCGAPVVASRISSLSEIAGDAALLVDPKSADDIAGGIIRLLRDEEARVRLSRAGMERAAKFSWERTARMTMEVYVKAVEKFRAHSRNQVS